VDHVPRGPTAVELGLTRGAKGNFAYGRKTRFGGTKGLEPRSSGVHVYGIVMSLDTQYLLAKKIDLILWIRYATRVFMRVKPTCTVRSIYSSKKQKGDRGDCCALDGQFDWPEIGADSRRT
jgi:hypothetical protein